MTVNKHEHVDGLNAVNNFSFPEAALALPDMWNVWEQGANGGGEQISLGCTIDANAAVASYHMVWGGMVWVKGVVWSEGSRWVWCE